MTIDADDVWHTLAEASGQESLAAADIQRGGRIVGDRRQDGSVIVDVVIPGLDPPIFPAMGGEIVYDYGMAKVTRGFTGRGRPAGDRRLPPGQYDTGGDWPVLTAEPTPAISTDDWSFVVEGLVERPSSWTWEEIHALPASTYEGPIHCVTTWSRFGMTFAGVSVDTLLEVAQPKPEASHVLAFSHTGYTTNLPLADVTAGKAWVAWEVDGQPLPAAHGGPARLLVPHLYLWKSAKWVAGLTLLDHDEQGFWERNGYHDRGDPWLEQRYQGD